MSFISNSLQGLTPERGLCQGPMTRLGAGAHVASIRLHLPLCDHTWFDLCSDGHCISQESYHHSTNAILLHRGAVITVIGTSNTACSTHYPQLPTRGRRLTWLELILICLDWIRFDLSSLDWICKGKKPVMPCLGSCHRHPILPSLAQQALGGRLPQCDPGIAQ